MITSTIRAPEPAGGETGSGHAAEQIQSRHDITLFQNVTIMHIVTLPMPKPTSTAEWRKEVT